MGGKPLDLTGKVFGDWKAIEYGGPGTRKYVCQCIHCEKYKAITTYGLTSGSQNTCRDCATAKNKVVKGMQFGDWEVLGPVEGKNTHVLCKCSCGTIKEINKYTLLHGLSNNCGHLKNLDRVIDLKGQTFEDLEVLEYLGDQRWKCKCSCGEICIKSRNHLLDGRAHRCGNMHNKNIQDSNRDYNNIKVINKLAGDFWVCQCSCGKTFTSFKHLVESKVVISCGCIESRQIHSIENTAEHLASKSASGKVNFTVLQNQCDIDKRYLKYYIMRSVKLKQIVEYNPGLNELNEIYDIVRRHTAGKVVKDLKNLEIQIYDPKVLIKFSPVEVSKDFKYSYLKSKFGYCYKSKCRFIHINSYDWDNEIIRNKIIYRITGVICHRKIISKDKIFVKQIDSDIGREFIKNWDNIGDYQCSIFIGCYIKDRLVGVLGYGPSRFYTKYQYELIRAYFIPGYYFEDADILMQKYFEDKFNPSSIIAYCDLQMYLGKTYLRMGYTLEKLTNPGYMCGVWVAQ